MNFIRRLTDAALDAVSAAGIASGQKALTALCAANRRNLLVTTVLNGALLLCAVGVALAATEARGWAVALLWAINLALLARTGVKAGLFVKRTVLPYWAVICVALPRFVTGLVQLRSWRAGTVGMIRAVFRYGYREKLPKPVTAFHPLATALGLVKSSGDIEDQVIRDFYPLVKSYMIEALLYNALLYGLGYGLFLFVVKNTVFVKVLHLTLGEVLFYPLTFLKAKV